MKSLAVIALLGLVAAQDADAAAGEATAEEGPKCDWWYYDEKSGDAGSIYGYQDQCVITIDEW